MQNNKPVSLKKTPRIVLVEDERVLSRLLEECIHEWYVKVDLLKFESGDEAWKELSLKAPDLLILDWSHPGLTGHEILQRLALNLARFPILLTSEYFAEHLQWFCDHGLRLGFLPKPFGIREFWAALNQLLGRSDHPEMQALVKTVVETHLLG